MIRRPPPKSRPFADSFFVRRSLAVAAVSVGLIGADCGNDNPPLQPDAGFVAPHVPPSDAGILDTSDDGPRPDAGTEPPPHPRPQPDAGTEPPPHPRPQPDAGDPPPPHPRPRRDAGRSR
jgi:hypothetical protein